MSRRLLTRAGSLLCRAFTACAGMADELYWPLELQEAPADDPRVCQWCRRPYACDDDWAVEDEEHWRVRMRCGDCGCTREVVLSNAAAVRLEERLAADVEAIARELSRRDAERMAADAEVFIADLLAGRIGAGDFAAPLR